MNEIEAINIVHRHLADINSIPVRLSLKKGIDEGQVSELIAAMQLLITQYKHKNNVPKKLAATFIDISPSFERTLDLYEQDTQDRIIDLKNMIVDLALEMMNAEPY
jgi:hypothetical protein